MRITERGQFTIPKALRDRFGITQRTELQALATEQGILIVKKVGSSPFARFVGCATVDGRPSTTDQMLAELRDDR